MFTIENLLDEIIVQRNKQVIDNRLQGDSLVEAGEKHGITKTYVQDIQKSLFPDNRLEEEKYRTLFETYAMDANLFCAATGLSEKSFRYLVITSRRNPNKKNFFKLWHDNSFDADFKKMIFDNLKENNKPVFIAGNEREYIMNIILQEKYRQQKPLDEFIVDYRTFLQTYNFVEIKPMVSKAFINKIEASSFILISKGRKIRFYDIESFDFTDLLETLNFKTLFGLEYSTLKFYRDNLDMCLEYGILDEYELHNLLRKISFDDKYKAYFQNVYFGRMPIIKFGNGTNRTDQLSNLIRGKKMDTVTATALYEEHYGIRATSLLAEKNIRKSIAEELTKE